MKIICPKCGNDLHFAAVVTSVFSIYLDSEGKTIGQEPLTEACAVVNRVECSVCHGELPELDYDLRTEETRIYKDEYTQLKQSNNNSDHHYRPATSQSFSRQEAKQHILIPAK